jgi:hypothetical protein
MVGVPAVATGPGAGTPWVSGADDLRGIAGEEIAQLVGSSPAAASKRIVRAKSGFRSTSPRDKRSAPISHPPGPEHR